MKTWEVVAVMHVGYRTYVEAETEEAAWDIAKHTSLLDWKKTDDGHDFEIYDAYEHKSKEVKNAT
jgi:hypothetical protein